MYCITTRFHLKHWWDLFPIYLSYRKMLPDLRSAPGLIRYAFLLESPTACCTLSIWQSDAAIISFSNVRSHITRVSIHYPLAHLDSTIPLCSAANTGYQCPHERLLGGRGLSTNDYPAASDLLYGKPLPPMRPFKAVVLSPVPEALAWWRYQPEASRISSPRPSLGWEIVVVPFLSNANANGPKR